MSTSRHQYCKHRVSHVCIAISPFEESRGRPVLLMNFRSFDASQPLIIRLGSTCATRGSLSKDGKTIMNLPESVLLCLFLNDPVPDKLRSPISVRRGRGAKSCFHHAVEVSDVRKNQK